MLGVAAATALPSEVFPFRKIFLPARRVWAGPEATVLMWNNVAQAWEMDVDQAKFVKEFWITGRVFSYPGRIDFLAPFQPEIEARIVGGGWRS